MQWLGKKRSHKTDRDRKKRREQEKAPFPFKCPEDIRQAFEMSSNSMVANERRPKATTSHSVVNVK